MFTTVESCMLFGPFEKERVFGIENSELHQKAGRDDGVSAVEFLYLRQGKNRELLYFIEAKSSSPNRSSSIQKYEDFIDQIVSKFLHSLNTYASAKLGRYMELDGEIAAISDKNLEYRFILVINGHERDWLTGLQEDLDSCLASYRKIWKSDVIVMNEAMAMELELISSYAKFDKEALTVEYIGDPAPDDKEKLREAAEKYLEQLREAKQ